MENKDTWTRLVVKSISFGVRFTLNRIVVSTIERLCNPVEFMNFHGLQSPSL